MLLKEESESLTRGWQENFRTYC